MFLKAFNRITLTQRDVTFHPSLNSARVSADSLRAKLFVWPNHPQLRAASGAVDLLLRRNGVRWDHE